MKRQYSGKKLVIVIFFVMLTVAVLCLTVCGGYALYNSMQDMMTVSYTHLDVYKRQAQKYENPFNRQFQADKSKAEENQTRIGFPDSLASMSDAVSCAAMAGLSLIHI